MVGEVVLPREATRALELVEAAVAWVTPREVSSLVKALDGGGGQQPLSHLKRVHKGLPPPEPAAAGALALAVLLCAGGPEEALAALAPAARDALARCGAAPRAVHVPRHAPLTRRQYEDANAVWPVHFHAGAAARSLGTWLPPPPTAAHDAMRAHMRAAIALAASARAAGARPVGALIVRRGADEGAPGVVVAACAEACGGDGGLIAHALMRAVEAVASQEREARPPPPPPPPPLAALEAGSKRPAEEATAAEAPEGGDGGGAGVGEHLCAGCDVYLTHEPCLMCAMALVHSRVGRVAYALPCEAHGALGSRYELHAERSLNHHFQVLRGVCRDEADAARLGPCGGVGA